VINEEYVEVIIPYLEIYNVIIISKQNENEHYGNKDNSEYVISKIFSNKYQYIWKKE